MDGLYLGGRRAPMYIRLGSRPPLLLGLLRRGVLQPVFIGRLTGLVGVDGVLFVVVNHRVDDFLLLRYCLLLRRDHRFQVLDLLSLTFQLVQMNSGLFAQDVIFSLPMRRRVQMFLALRQLFLQGGVFV